MTSLVDAPRAATIHEYLDWTVTAEEASTDEELVRSRGSGGAVPVCRTPRLRCCADVLRSSWLSSMLGVRCCSRGGSCREHACLVLLRQAAMAGFACPGTPPCMRPGLSQA